MDLNILLNKNIYINDLLRLCLIFIITIFFCYFLGFFLSRILFIIFFILFLKSKRDYFWIAFFLLVSLSPGGLFPSGTFDTYGRVPLFTITSGWSLTFFEIFTFIAIFKAMIPKNSNYPIPFKRNLLIILIFIITLLIYSFLLGISMDNIILTIRYLIPLSFFYIIPKLFKNPEDYIYFILLILPFSLLDFSGQVYELMTGKMFLSQNLTVSPEQMEQNFSKLGGFRVQMAPYLNLLCFIFALFISYCKNVRFRSVFFSIALINYISIILTATRGWIIAYTAIIILLFFFTICKRSLLNIRMLILGIVILSLLFLAFPVIKYQIVKSLIRLSTVEKLAEGDLTAGGTVSRLSERGPRVMEKFYESPIIGFGFSDDGYKYDDAHVGNQNLLREGGVLEALLFLFFITEFILIVHSTRKKLHHNNIFKDSLILFIIGLIGIFIIHSSSVQIFGFALPFQSRVFLAIFFMFAGFFVKYSITMDNEQFNPNKRVI